MLVLLVGLFVYFALRQTHFLTHANIENLLTSVSILWVVSMGMTFVVLTAGIDLSVGALLALSGIVLSKLFNNVGLPCGSRSSCTILIAGMIGAGVNGVLIGRVGLSFFVVTLGTLSIYEGDREHLVEDADDLHQLAAPRRDRVRARARGSRRRSGS